MANCRRTELSPSDSDFKALFENLAIGAALLNVVRDECGEVVGFCVREANQALKSLVGTDLDSAIGPLMSESAGGCESLVSALLARTAETGQRGVSECSCASLSKHLRISTLPIHSASVWLLLEDITETRRREDRLRQKSADLERFAYSVAHDLKSPLTTVLGFAEYLHEDLEASDRERIHEDVHYIQAASRKMAALLDELLELSRIGRTTEICGDVSLQDVVTDAIMLTKGICVARQVTVLFGNDDVIIRGYRPQLVHLYQNLIENAAKFMGDQPHPIVEIGVRTVADERTFYVNDNGQGMTADLQLRAFDMFHKHPSDSRGNGMGLAIAKRIVEVHGGRIWVESAGQGTGSTFYFTLPGLESDQTDARSMSDKQGHPVGSRGVVEVGANEQDSDGASVVGAGECGRESG